MLCVPVVKSIGRGDAIWQSQICHLGIFDRGTTATLRREKLLSSASLTLIMAYLRQWNTLIKVDPTLELHVTLTVRSTANKRHLVPLGSTCPSLCPHCKPDRLDSAALLHL